jgi:hypothetical protein
LDFFPFLFLLSPPAAAFAVRTLVR